MASMSEPEEPVEEPIGDDERELLQQDLIDVETLAAIKRLRRQLGRR
jgi:hypothetical protein